MILSTRLCENLSNEVEFKLSSTIYFGFFLGKLPKFIGIAILSHIIVSLIIPLLSVVIFKNSMVTTYLELELAKVL